MIDSTLGWMFSVRAPGINDGNDEYSMFVDESCDIAHAFWDVEGTGISGKVVEESVSTKVVIRRHGHEKSQDMSFHRTIIYVLLG